MPNVRIKICGLTSPAEAVHAAAAGADAIGLNFYPRSPRYLTREGATTLLRELPPFVEPVGLFVEEAPAAAAAVLRDLGISTLQWHGRQHAPLHLSPLRHIPAFAVRDRASLTEIEAYLTLCRAQDALPCALLVDAHVPGQYGGTGQVAPWDLLADFRPGIPVILAGGLTPENVAEAVRRVRPYAVDVASGVEAAPGRKDPDKVRRFIAEARAA